MYVIGNFEQKNTFGGLLGFVSLKQQHVVEGTFLKNKHMYIKEFHWKFCKKNFFLGGGGGILGFVSLNQQYANNFITYTN